MRRRRRDSTWKIYAGLMVVSLVLLAVFLVRDFAGKRTSSSAFADVKSAVLQHADLSLMQEADSQMAKRLYGLDPADFADFLLYYPNNSMGAEELLLIRAEDTASQERAIEAMQARIAAQKNSFEGYGIEQTRLLTDSVVEADGNYLLLAVAENAEEIRRSFLKAL